MGGRIPARDHLGNDYPSLSAMARAYGLHLQTLHKRLNLPGWTLEEVLTSPLAVRGGRNKRVTFRGKEYRSINQLAQEVGINPDTLRKHLRYGYDIETAATAKTLPRLRHDKPLVIAGHHYKSLAEALEVWKISRVAYKARRHRGMTPAQALSTPSRVKLGKWYGIKGGDCYRSRYALAKAYGISKSALYKRLKQMSLREALVWLLQRRRKK